MDGVRRLVGVLDVGGGVELFTLVEAGSVILLSTLQVSEDLPVMVGEDTCSP